MNRAARRAEREARHEQMLKRYNKQRQRNVAATPGRFPLVLVLDSLKGEFNVPKIFRSALAFGVAEIHLVGIGAFDPAPAKGAFRKVPARFHDSFDTAHAELAARGLRLFTLEPAAGTGLHEATLPAHSAFVFGHEETGLSFDPDDYPGMERLAIRHFGEMESLNVSVAASIVMYEYSRQHAGADATAG